MIEVVETNVIPLDEFAHRKASGLVVPMSADEGLRVVDCGDVRGLAKGTRDLRVETHGSDVVPGRLFGSPSGLAMISLVALAAQIGEAPITEFVKEYGTEAFTDFAADLSSRAYQQNDGLEMHHHSAVPNEGNETKLATVSDQEHDDGPLGCKFLLFAGYILGKATEDMALQGSKRVGEVAGHSMPLDEAREGARILSQHFPATYAISRQMLSHTLAKHPEQGVTILKDAPVANRQTAVVVDLAGYRAHAERHVQAGVPRYHHTPGIATELIPNLLPEYRLDPKLLEAAGTLIGSATRDALSGESTPHDLKVEVIPPEYAAAA